MYDASVLRVEYRWSTYSGNIGNCRKEKQENVEEDNVEFKNSEKENVEWEKCPQYVF